MREFARRLPAGGGQWLTGRLAAQPRPPPRSRFHSRRSRTPRPKRRAHIVLRHQERTDCDRSRAGRGILRGRKLPSELLQRKLAPALLHVHDLAEAGEVGKEVCRKIESVKV